MMFVYVRGHIMVHPMGHHASHLDETIEIAHSLKRPTKYRNAPD